MIASHQPSQPNPSSDSVREEGLALGDIVGLMDGSGTRLRSEVR